MPVHVQTYTYKHKHAYAHALTNMHTRKHTHTHTNVHAHNTRTLPRARTCTQTHTSLLRTILHKRHTPANIIKSSCLRRTSSAGVVARAKGPRCQLVSRCSCSSGRTMHAQQQPKHIQYTTLASKCMLQQLRRRVSVSVAVRASRCAVHCFSIPSCFVALCGSVSTCHGGEQCCAHCVTLHVCAVPQRALCSRGTHCLMQTPAQPFPGAASTSCTLNPKPCASCLRLPP